MRVPNAGKGERERQALIKRLEKKLAYFQSIPAHRRDDECADEGERDCRMMLAELGVPGHVRQQQRNDGTGTLMSLEEFLDDLEKR